jgi:hypothetical protein
MSTTPVVEAYPLQWPAGWPRAKRRDVPLFKESTVSTQTHFVLEELRRMGATHPIISSNVELRKDGLPYSNRRQPDDPGVAVYFTLDGHQRCLACDEWTTVADNLKAIGKTIEAIRGIERWGASAILDRMFSAFTALPHIVAEAPWYETLGVTPNATPDQIREARVGLAKKYHPDSGSQPDAVLMARINGAADIGLKGRE